MAAPLQTRVPFKIYTIENYTSDFAPGYETRLRNRSIPTPNFLIGVTEDEIDYSKEVPTVSIYESALNYHYDFSGRGLSSTEKAEFVVSNDSDTFYVPYWYITIDSKRWYLKRSPNNPVNRTKEIFEFHVSPQRIEPSWEKLQTETKTRGGWEVQHWGSRLTDVNVTCRTGALTKVGSDFLANTDDITKSDAWRKVSRLKEIYFEDQSDRNSQTRLGFYYMDRFFIGYFTRFQGPTVDAEKPNIMDFSFTFRVEKES